MIPSGFDYHAPATLPEAIALLREHRRRRQGALRGAEPPAAPQAPARLGRPPRRHRPHPRPRVRPRGARHAPHRRPARARPRWRTRSSSAPATRSSSTPPGSSPIPLVRNRATVGGNLAHGDPGNDHPATMLALGAEVVAVGPEGERVIPIDKFFVGLFATALRPDEILTEIRIPVPGSRSGGAYQKLERKVGDYATAAAAAQVTLTASGDHRAGGPRAHQRRPDAGPGHRRGGVPARPASRTRPRWPRRRGSPPRVPPRPPTGAGRSSTSARWRASWRHGPWPRPSSGRGGTEPCRPMTSRSP